MRIIGNTETMTFCELDAELKFAKDNQQTETANALRAIIRRRFCRICGIADGEHTASCDEVYESGNTYYSNI